jgi:predicted SAM-dependent methyltransferase
MTARADSTGVRLEIGAGEHPREDYQIHTDILPLPGIDVVCRLDRLPFADASIAALRANHVLEHQSYELIPATLQEWARVLKPGGRVDIGVPDARFIAEQWVREEIDTAEANYWILGGHSDRAAHRGVDRQGVPRWLWNAHHTLFDAAWLRRHLQDKGFVDIEIVTYDVRNLRCTCRRA